MLQIISIILEAIIVIISLMVAIKNKKGYGYGFALTFFIYVVYDSVREFNLVINSLIVYILFFIATISILISVLDLYLNTRIKKRKK
jgi:hypothetical protein